MKCLNCHTVNLDDAKYCENCGQSMERLCPNCGKPVSPNARFCRNCGYRLLGENAPTVSAPPAPVAPAAASAPLSQFIPSELMSKLEVARANHTMQGERRVVTVLFCDVKGSTAMAERLDPEDWTELMNAAFQYLIKPVYRYEGTVARLMGDAILAFFGAPIAHEDDPQRAVMAGLEIVHGIQDYRARLQRERGLDFNVRVGINTGLVVVGAVGSDLRVEYTAMGDAVNLAARMEQTAQAGTVQIAHDTYRLIAPLFDFEPLGGIEVKGKAEPVQAYRVLRAKAQPGRLRGIEGLDSPLIGREQEMRALKSAMAALLQGRGQIVAVMGEAGLGKSRLVTEWRHSLAASETRVSWYEGRSLSYETTTPYAPFINLFTRLFDLGADESDAQRYTKISARLAELDPERVQELAPYLATLLGVAVSAQDIERVRYLEPPIMRERIFTAVLDLVTQLAQVQPLVMVLEDLHWADPTSLDLLAQLAARTEQLPLMLVAVFRPQRQEPSWRFHELATREHAHNYTTVVLEPLDESHARELVANLLHVEDLPEKVRALILRKAEGNPFFVEEVIRSLLDSQLVVRDNGHWRATREIENIAVPDTLAGVITARLDRLDDNAKRTIQTAAVIGREFPFHTLADVYRDEVTLDGALANLQRRELVREKSRTPQRVFRFKHTLTQETAYGSILLRTRRELHRRIAESLERAEPERAHEIARHFLEAQESARALPYLVTAAERAARGYSTQEAIGYFKQALQILPSVDDLSLARRVYEGLGGAYALSNEIHAAVENYEAMQTLGKARGDVPMQISALNKLSQVLALRLGQFPEAESRLADAERLAREYQDMAGLSEAIFVRCMMCTAVADFEGVIHHLDESATFSRELDMKEQLASSLAHIAQSQVFMTRWEESWQTTQRGLAFAREAGDRLNESLFLSFMMPFWYMRQGDFDAAQRAAEEGYRIGVQIGFAEAQAVGAMTLGMLAHLRAEYEAALGHFAQMIEGGKRGYPWFVPMALCAIGTIYLDISRELLPKTIEYHTQALELVEQPGGLIGGATVWAELGFCALAAGRPERAKEYFEKAQTVPTTLMYLERPRLLLGSARVALMQHDLERASALEREARAFITERKMKYVYPHLELTAAHIAHARAQHERALEHFRQADAISGELQTRAIRWQALAGAAHVLDALGRADEAEAQRQHARALVAEIAAGLRDAQLRALFISNANQQIGDGAT